MEMEEGIALTKSLDGMWSIVPDPDNRGMSERWYEAYPQEDALPAPVPGQVHMSLPDYQGEVWYRTSFSCDGLRPGYPRALIRFGSVDFACRVWLNGKDLGWHEGGETPFSLEAGDALRRGENELIVRVIIPVGEDHPIEGLSLFETPCFCRQVGELRQGGTYNEGGIPESVALLFKPLQTIESVFVRPDPHTGEVALEIALENAADAETEVPVWVRWGEWERECAAQRVEARLACAPGKTSHTLRFRVPQHRLWDLDDPFLYRLEVILCPGGYEDTYHCRFGFREFSVRNGYFTLNGRRIFLKSAHTVNQFPNHAGALDVAMLRTDLLYAKSCGFNTVRWIGGNALPQQLDLCDEIGLMAYEETRAGWVMINSPRMGRYFDMSVRDTLLRDRNHPSFTILGLLNECADKPKYLYAAGMLPLIRSLDPDKLVLFSSGRWDCEPGIGSVSNPGSLSWEHMWGAECAGAAEAPREEPYPAYFFVGAGDIHFYPRVPHSETVWQYIHTLGDGTKPVFISEHGVGSVMHCERELKHYQQAGLPLDRPEPAMLRRMVDGLRADWQKYGMQDTYPFIEDMLTDSYRHQSAQRAFGFDAIRGNKNAVGFNFTSISDQAMSGEGVWSLWREFKPGMMETLQAGFAPLRWCTHLYPTHIYPGGKLHLQVWLADEDALPAGLYKAQVRLLGPHGTAFARDIPLNITRENCGSFVWDVMDEWLELTLEPGVYELAVNMESGAAPTAGRALLYVSAPVGSICAKAHFVGLHEKEAGWLLSHGVQESAPESAEVILVGDMPGDPGVWDAVYRWAEAGKEVLFLNPGAFARGEESTYWLRLPQKGRYLDLNDWLYHREWIARRHPVFEGLKARLMDWAYYEQVISRGGFVELPAPEDTMIAGFAPGCSYPDLGNGYFSALSLGRYAFGKGGITLNAMHLLEEQGHPAADRLLANLIRYLSGLTHGR